MSVLIDTSVWIEYFRNSNCPDQVDFLIDENLVVINEIILSELIPFLKIKRQKRLIDLLNKIILTKININWDEIIEYQYKCLKKGINGIGIPDLIISQNANQYCSSIYSLDKHFKLIQPNVNIDIFHI